MSVWTPGIGADGWDEDKRIAFRVISHFRVLVGLWGDGLGIESLGYERQALWGSGVQGEM